jgi:hypothetical protein
MPDKDKRVQEWSVAFCSQEEVEVKATPDTGKQSSEDSLPAFWAWLKKWAWVVPVVALVAPAFQAYNSFHSKQPNIVIPTQTRVEILMNAEGNPTSSPPPDPSRSRGVVPSPATPPAPWYEAKVMVYRASEIPKFSVNDGVRRPDEYTAGIATFHLPAGAYDIKAEYPERICEAVFSIPHEGEVEATCHLR